MSHKVHPKSFRIKETSDWDVRGFYRNPPELLEEDFKIRKFLKEKLAKASLERIEIERSSGKLNIIISSGKPGIIIGRGGEGIEQLKRLLEEKILNKGISISKKEEKTAKIKAKTHASEQVRYGASRAKKEIRLEIREVKNPWTSAALIAQGIVQQLERRIPYRRVLKQTLSKISGNKEIKGARIELSGRLDGKEIARREWLKIGRLPLQTLRSDIDYAKDEAFCTYGTTGIKVWLYKGEKFNS